MYVKCTKSITLTLSLLTRAKSSNRQGLWSCQTTMIIFLIEFINFSFITHSSNFLYIVPVLQLKDQLF